jgi:CelD/BcsL family acetyltransferase involved in cellulose biosynthesis
MTLLTIDPVVDSAWSGLLERAPAATVFHQPSWLRLLREQYGYAISAWCVAGDDGRLAAGLPVALAHSRLTGARLISLPFSDACQPVHDPAGGIQPAALALAVAKERARIGLPLQVRGELVDAPGGVVIHSHAQHRLRLDPDVDRVVARFAPQVRRGIAKANREGVTIESRRDRAGLGRFYAMHMATRRRQGMPTQPRRFILKFAELFDARLGFVLLARHQERDIAGAVFLTAGGTLTYKYGASRRRDLGLRPNNLLFMEAIRWGCENGQRTLDFGRTDLDNEGLLAFKRSWGADESPLSYTYLGPRKPDTTGGLPRRAMSAAIRHSPPTFGRLVGEALYRSFA